VQQRMIFTSILQHFPMRDTTGNQHFKVGGGGRGVVTFKYDCIRPAIIF
jgi:hypothetical protein